MVADIVIFDPDTVKPLPLEVVHDFPTGAKRIKEPAQGIMATIVNGQVLLEDGKHTGALARPRAAQHLLQGAARVIAVPAGPHPPAARVPPSPVLTGEGGGGGRH